MAQPPFKSDVFQIEPTGFGVRTISRDPTTGGLKFVDPSFPSGLLLSQLAGLQTISGTYVVGRGGGATYTSIQDALDAVPVSSSSLLPHVILVNPGVYSENLTISKDGVYVVGLGYVQIQNASADPTITIIEDVDTIPKMVGLVNLTISNDTSAACVFVDGSNTFAQGSVVVHNLLAAGDTLVIGGITLTGVAGARTSGSNNFNATLGTVDALAGEIAVALQDVANSFAASVIATSSLNVVSLQAVVPGTPGNSITLSATTSPSGGMTVSGSTLSGGGGAGSEVGQDGITLQDCNLVTEDAGGSPIITSYANIVHVSGGAWSIAGGVATTYVSQTADFKVSNVDMIGPLEVSYTTSDNMPAVSGSNIQISNVTHVGDVLCNFVDDGSLSLISCFDVGDVSQSGNQGLRVQSSNIGDLTLSGTTYCVMSNSTRGVGVANDNPTLAETMRSGTIACNSSPQTVPFDIPQPDVDYFVYLDCSVLGAFPLVTSKSTTDFTIQFVSPVSTTVGYTVFRSV